MGSLQAQEMATHADMDIALTWHLRANHFPPIPLSMIEPCKQAIFAMRDGDIYRAIDLPEGVTYKGMTNAPAWDVAKQHHLDPWLQLDDD